MLNIMVKFLDLLDKIVLICYNRYIKTSHSEKNVKN